MSKELRVGFVYKKIQKSKEQLIQIQNSVDPVTATGKKLEEINIFLIELEMEISDNASTKSSVSRFKASLLPLVKLLSIFFNG